MEYLDYIIANYDRLPADRQTSLVFNLARLVAPDTPEAKAGISKFIRSKALYPHARRDPVCRTHTRA